MMAPRKLSPSRGHGVSRRSAVSSRLVHHGHSGYAFSGQMVAYPTRLNRIARFSERPPLGNPIGSRPERTDVS